MPRHSRRRGALLLAAILVAGAVTVGVLLLPGLDDRIQPATIGPEGGTVRVDGLTIDVPPRAFPSATSVRVQTGTAEAEELRSGSIARSPTYAVESERRPRRAVKLRIQVPGGLPRDAIDRLAVATRRRAGDMPSLEVGSFDPRRREYVVTTTHFSPWQLREITATIGRGLDSAGQVIAQFRNDLPRALGVRGDPPACPSPPPRLRVSVSGQEGEREPLLYACLDTVSGRPGLRVSNNRAVGLQFEVPRGMDLEDVEGRSAAEAVWDVLNQGLPSGQWRLVPAGGSVFLTGKLPTRPLEFEATTQAAVFDVLLFALTRGASGELRRAARLADFGNCLHRAASGVRKLSLSSVRSAWASCGEYLADRGPLAVLGGLFVGSEAAGAVIDSFGALVGPTVSVSVEEIPPGVQGPLTVDGVAPVELGMSRADAEEATGLRFRKGPFCVGPAGDSDKVAFELTDERIAIAVVSGESTLRTKSGIGLGDKLGRVFSTYGTEARRLRGSERSAQGPDAIVVPGGQGERGIVFWADPDGAIGLMAAGPIDEIEKRVEFCA